MIFASLAALGLIFSGLPPRFSLPGAPLWDPDTWGYLRPALAVFNGEPFQQVDGRHGMYPTLLIGFLSFPGGFPAILHWQQGLGGLSAVVLWGVWLLWWGLLPVSRVRDVLAPVAGLGLIGLYYLNPNTILSEATLRPEAVFPFFGFLQLLCATGFVFLAGRKSGRLGLILTGSLSVFLAYCCFCLKPSWAFATAFTLLPVAVFLIKPGAVRLPAAIALGTAVLGIGGTALLYKTWMRPDNFSRTFLPNTLFTIHADLIHTAFLRNPASPDAEKIRALLPVFTTELDYARAHPGTYKVLGFDADYLMYRSRFREPLAPFQLSIPDYTGFLYRSYLAAWKSDPGAMGRKILRQMEMFFRPTPGAFLSNKTALRKEWEASLEIVAARSGDLPGTAGEMLLANRGRAERGAESELVLRSPGWVRPLREWCAAATPVLVPVFFLVLLSGTIVRRGSLTAGWTAALFFSAAFGNALAVSVIHALDIERYCQTFAPFLALSLAAMGVWLPLAGLECLRRLQQSKNHET